MNFTCTINMDNAAFEDPRELGRLLTKITAKVADGHTSGKCMDINGTSVGTWEIA